MENGINKELLDLVTDAKKNPKKYQDIKNCKNLSEVYSFIKKIHPEYTFSEEELGQVILHLARIPDGLLSISGGIRASKEDIEALSGNIKHTGHIAKFGSKLIDMFSDLIFSEEEMDPMELQQRMNDIINTKSGEKFTSDYMYNIEDSLDTITKIKNNQTNKLTQINSEGLKKIDKLGNNLHQLQGFTNNK